MAFISALLRGSLFLQFPSPNLSRIRDFTNSHDMSTLQTSGTPSATCPDLIPISPHPPHHTPQRYQISIDKREPHIHHMEHSSSASFSTNRFQCLG
ncbi:hypothetical protein BKA59DRAFT_226367 [Fusarium tricinctum]|uniref:Uncharacterized protein n=1 Tax=Fusarium tricinctum TaxID=61284 RepID=A0A8K0RXE2_9HYPO|nr:hypothetical protein BKA59DRAFT_226367 [Fusarium tricinctum]